MKKQISYSFPLMLIVLLILSSISYQKKIKLNNQQKEEEIISDDLKINQKNGSLVKDLYRKEFHNGNLRKVQMKQNEDEWFMNMEFYKYLYHKIFGKTQIHKQLEMEVQRLHDYYRKKNNQRAKLQSISSYYTITNYNNFLYTQYFYMGTSVQQVELIVDTGSDWVVVIDSSCGTSCTTGYTYDETTSTSYSKLDSSLYVKTYGSGQVYSYDSQDDMYLDSSKSAGVTSFQFYFAIAATGISPYSGLLGLSRNSASTSGVSPGPLYYRYLKTQGVISSNSFSLLLLDSDSSTSSKIIYGNSDFTTYSKGDSYKVTITSQNFFFWQVLLQGLKIGENENWQYAFSTDILVIFDSGTSLIYTPQSLGTLLTYYALSQTTYVTQDGYQYVDCGTSISNFPSIYLLLGGYWFEIPPQKYIIEIVQNTQTLCMFGFVQSTFDFWLVGDVFLRNYYSAYDDDTGEMQFAPISGGSVNTIPSGTAPSHTFTDFDLPEVYITVYVFVGLIAIIGIIIGVLFATGVLQLSKRKIYTKSDKIDDQSTIIIFL